MLCRYLIPFLCVHVIRFQPHLTPLPLPSPPLPLPTPSSLPIPPPLPPPPLLVVSPRSPVETGYNLHGGNLATWESCLDGLGMSTDAPGISQRRSGVEAIMLWKWGSNDLRMRFGYKASKDGLEMALGMVWE